MRSRRVLIPLGLVLAAGLTAILAWFQPWKLWVDHRVDEKLPAVALAPAAPSPAAGSATSRARQPAGASPSPRSSASTTAGPVLLSRGELISHEHPTHGTVSVVRQPDGGLLLAIAHLDTSNGPDVHVWLTDAPVRPGSDGWHLFDDGAHVSLGTLKGNVGNQVYRIPSGVDLSRLTSVSIWCDRFDVSFGAAQLVPVH
ncbi:MAG: DM13 domain-containing protein [Pseudonocardiales bacterium]